MTSPTHQHKSNPALPGDLAACHELILAQSNHLQELLALKDELMASLAQQEREKARLLHRVEMLLRQIYGRKSEKIDPAQLLLFAEQVMEQAAARAAEEVEEEAPAAPKRKGHGRKKLPAELPHLPVEHDVPEKDKVCPECGAQKHVIGKRVTEQLEYAPASLFILDHVRSVYACPCCQQEVSVAAKPAQPIEKGLAGPGLLAQVMVSKYTDHLPLYRQERIFARLGAEISRKTMCGWVLSSAQSLGPVVALMKERALESKVLHTDDTPVSVRGPGGNYQGRFWVYLGDGEHPYTVYDFTPDRRRDGPADFLKTFTGTDEQPRYLQADAFGGYDGIYKAGNNVIEVACWAHARRKFHDARGSDVNRAHQMLAWIKRLYEIERDAKERDAAQRRDLRQEHAKPLLKTIGQWLKEQQGQVLPKSPMGEAITYVVNQWQALNRYMEDGDLAIDNNAAENALRGIALGRKNYLFVGSDGGGRAAAVLYSLIRSAQRNGVEPYLYLRDLLLRVTTHPNKEIHLLLPDHWKRAILPTLDPPRRP